MLVDELMSTDVTTLAPGTSSKVALMTLADAEVTAAPVVDASGVLVGIVSESDLIAGHLEPDPRTRFARPATRAPVAAVPDVATVMTTAVEVAHPEDDVADVLARLTRRRLKSLPVVDEGRRVVGIVSRSDVVRLLARSDDDVRLAIVRLLRDTVGGTWEVEVRGGSVRLWASEVTIHDVGAAELLAATVPGVLAVEPVHVVPQPPTGATRSAAKE